MRIGLTRAGVRIPEAARQVGVFLGLSNQDSATVVEHLHALAALNPIGTWIVSEQVADPARRLAAGAARQAFPKAHRLHEVLEDLAQDLPAVASVEVMERLKGNDRGFVQRRTVARFIGIDDTEVATFDMAFTTKALRALMVGDDDAFQRNTHRLGILRRQLGVTEETLADVLADLALPIVHLELQAFALRSSP